jgi:hypothetical protein
MQLKRILVLAALGLFTVAASAAQVIVPAVGAGKGNANSNWQSDVLLHNAAPRDIELTMSLHVGTDVIGPKPFVLKAKNTFQMLDITKAVFGFSSGTGALVFDLTDRDLKYLAVTSRTYNRPNDITSSSEYGQDIPAISSDDAVSAGQIAVLTNPGMNAGLFRFNFGIYALESSTVRWELLRADGEVAATKEVAYVSGQHAQYNSGVTDPAFFGAEPKVGDSLYARVLTGKAVVYGSSINQIGDPTFVPGNTVREDVTLNLSVDIDEDGTADVLDEDGDGVLDAPLVVYTSLYPAYFRIIATSEFGDPVTLEIVSSEADAVFRDVNGTMRVGAAGDLKNTTGSIVIKATSNGTEALFTIPVRFK